MILILYKTELFIQLIKKTVNKFVQEIETLKPPQNKGKQKFKCKAGQGVDFILSYWLLNFKRMFQINKLGEINFVLPYI